MTSYFQKGKPVAYVRLFYERATDILSHKTIYRMVCSLATKPVTIPNLSSKKDDYDAHTFFEVLRLDKLFLKFGYNQNIFKNHLLLGILGNIMSFIFITVYIFLFLHYEEYISFSFSIVY